MWVTLGYKLTFGPTMLNLCCGFQGIRLNDFWTEVQTVLLTDDWWMVWYFRLKVTFTSHPEENNDLKSGSSNHCVGQLKGFIRDIKWLEYHSMSEKFERFAGKNVHRKSNCNFQQKQKTQVLLTQEFLFLPGSPDECDSVHNHTSEYPGTKTPLFREVTNTCYTNKSYTLIAQTSLSRLL